MTRGAREVCRFVILANGRSGSNMLVTTLDEHPNVQCVGEVFNPGSSFGYEKWARKSLRRRIADRYARDYSIESYLDSCCVRDPRSRTHAVGFKVIYPGQFDRWASLRYSWRKHNFRVISLFRRNLLRKYISSKIARRDGTWSSSEKRDAAIRIRFDLTEFKREVARMEAIYALLDSLTLEFRGIRIVYEELLQDYVSGIQEVLRFLEVSDAEADSIKPRTVRQNPSRISDLIENYDEILLALRGTTYEEFLELEPVPRPMG